MMRFELGRSVIGDESRQLEFKAVSSQNPVRTIVDVCEEYAVAFLNSLGGRILWGVRDKDKVVEGVVLNAKQRDELRRVVMDKLNSIEPKIDPTKFRLEVHVVDEDRDVCVVSLTVPRGAGGPFYVGGKHAYVRLDGANKRLSGPQLTDWITRRASRARKVNLQEFVPIEIYHNGEKLPLNREIMWDFRSRSDTRPAMIFDFHLPPNSGGRRKEKFGIVTSPFFTAITEWRSGRHIPVQLPDGRHLFTAEDMTLNLMPGGWYKNSLTGEFLERVVNRREEMLFRFFTNSGPLDVHFVVRMLGVDLDAEMRKEQRMLKELEKEERRILKKLQKNW